ncbi:hypothetical protein AV530_010790 [Patagioenas fasciata monilis]|uniref:Trichohyalin-like n=1 Tax=Patagioenas fasciata monilis TaxID=372326 RepID=A0A1V4K7Z2_PATFA|nr:hypothetical protein AV530_010790 [Patagioenas fasciata monilis]
MRRQHRLFYKGVKIAQLPNFPLRLLKSSCLLREFGRLCDKKSTRGDNVHHLVLRNWCIFQVSSMSISHVQCCDTPNKDPCCFLWPRCPVTHFPVCAQNPDFLSMPLISSAKRNVIDSRPEASSLVRGARVLARREADGYYYLGHIAQESPQRQMAHAMVDTAVNTDSWLTETAHKEEADRRQQGAETEANVKDEHGVFESRVAEAPIQHSQRSPSLGTRALVPFRRQSFFDRVNESLEKDSLTIKSALHVRRPHRTSNVQARRSTNLLNLLKDKSITKMILHSASQERWKEVDFNRAKIEHKRWQEKQRQLKREQQQEADGIRCQLRRDNQRQRLHQRTLQGLEKQLEHTDRALQHLALLQAAGAERSRKESFLQEEEKRKASQRLQFLRAQSVQREELQAQRNERSFEQEKERLDFLRSRMQSRQEVLKQQSQEMDRQQKQHQAAKEREFQSRDRSRQKMEKEGQKLCDLQQYLREQNLLMLRASVLA